MNTAPGRGSSVQPPDLNAPDAFDDPNNNRTSGLQQRNRWGAYPQSPRRRAEPPTEFQRFAASATGKLLPVYGSWLFDENVPSTFAPVDRIPVTPDYVVGPGDEILLRIWGQINFNQRLTVDRAGEVFIPQVGSVNVAGVRYAQLPGVVQSAIGRVFKNFDLNVNLGQLRSIQVFVMGQARRPGSYTVSSLSTLVNALFASGGPSSTGSLRHIQLKRNGALVTELDLYDLLLQGDKTKDAPLMPGDVIFIPQIGPQIAISGSVTTPAIYELKDGNTVKDALGFAGGLSPIAASRNVALDRVADRQGFATITLNVDSPEAAATVLRQGDILRVLSVVPHFEQTVTLKGNVADPGRFPWHAGMRVRDLIPSRESLLTRDYWQERNRLAEPRPFDPDDAQNQSRQIPLGTQRGLGQADPDRDIQITSSAMPFADQRANAAGHSSDRTLASVQSGSLPGAATYREFPSRNTVLPSAPEINWEYAVIERRDPARLTTDLLPFDLGKALQPGNDADNVELQPGDVVTIFSRADFKTPQSLQTRYVRLEGEVSHAGVYSVKPGETLRQVIERAGGLSPKAYLYGSQFTRESTRREQQLRLNDFLDSLERDLNQGASTLSTRAMSAEQFAGAQATIQNQRAQIERLRQTQASGRIVLSIDPESQASADLPDLPLEDGDRFYVPARLSTVNVVGTVYTQGSFLYADNQRLADYLKQAGGPSRFADDRHTFVIRANGTVISRPATAGFVTGRFGSLPMYPGDTLVVPEKVAKLPFIRSLVDWTQVFTNFALGAAAINVIK